MDARVLAGLERLLEPGGPVGTPGPELGAEAPASAPARITPAAPELWEDGRPKGWPTLQLRVRAKPFDVYCEHPTDVTLDGIGIPVVNGHTVGREDLARGWYCSRAAGVPGRIS